MTFLTSQEQIAPRDPTVFPTAQFVYLALVRVSEPIAITSIFPYAWKLVLHFKIGDNSNASFYAGILISAFAFAECLTSMLWGALSDRIGRKPVLLLGCCGTIISLLTFGASTNFWMALLGRALGGLLNGNQGVSQTMVAELVGLPEYEPRAYAVMPFVWSIGTMIGPAIGGYFAEPCENFPSVCSTDSVFARFPYLLPNVICAFFLLWAVILGYFMIEETHPDLQPLSTQGELDHSTAQTSLMATAGATSNAPVDLRRGSYGTFNAVEIEEFLRPTNVRLPSKPAIAPCRDFQKPVVMLIVALGLFTYHSMTYDHLLPIYLQDQRANNGASALFISEAFAGGLGLSTQQVGVIMFFNGLIALLVQGVVFPFAATWLGIWKVFLLCTLGHPVAYFVVPYLAFLPPNLLQPGIYVALITRNLFAILAWPVILILLKEASPSPSSLGKINGLAAAVGASSRTLASPIAGFLYGMGIRVGVAPLAWWASALVAVLGIVQMLFIGRQKVCTSHVRTIAHFASTDDIRAALIKNRMHVGMRGDLVEEEALLEQEEEV